MTPTAPFVCRVAVSRVQRLSPSFVRLWLASCDLADFGVDGKVYDLRIKVIVPGEAGCLPDVDPAGPDWYRSWLAIPEAQRGYMRTYSVRDIVGSGADTELVLDIVVHGTPGDSGHAGPGSEWAANARPGDEALVVGPRRGAPYGGIEFNPPEATSVLLAGDETAVPAISRILADLDPSARGRAYLEVPLSEDILPIQTPEQVRITWLPRDGAELGQRLSQTVTDYLGVAATASSPAAEEIDVWETPTYSASGEPLRDTSGIPDLYAWIAGECSIVTSLRRHLVKNLAVNRKQVAFMGYWRRTPQPADT